MTERIDPMSEIVRQWWEKAARDFLGWYQHPIDVEYGVSITEEKLRLIGPVTGKRVLEIGCGGGQCSIAFAKQGALVTGFDIAAAQIDICRELAEQNGVSITLIQHDMTNLSPIQTESQDVVFSAYAFFYVEDLLACFREVHRVLKADGLFVWSVPHPFAATIDPKTMLPTRSYFDTGLVVEGLEASDEPGFAFASVNRTASDYYNTAVDAGFRIDRMLEPDPRPVDTANPRNWLWDQTPRFLETFPPTLIFKCRKA
jgi:2-polyprenyl-3-methyl-5-hydroxy-6-metoxy-1,4-benzoquinol methylase